MKRLETKYIVAIIISLIIGASILGYGYLDYKYKKDALEQKIRTEEQVKEDARKAAEAKQQQYLDCAKEANQKARDLVKTNIEVMEKLGKTNTQEYKEYKIRYDAGLKVSADYDNYYKDCLNRYRLDITVKEGVND